MTSRFALDECGLSFSFLSKTMHAACATAAAAIAMTNASLQDENLQQMQRVGRGRWLAHVTRTINSQDISGAAEHAGNNIYHDFLYD